MSLDPPRPDPPPALVAIVAIVALVAVVLCAHAPVPARAAGAGHHLLRPVPRESMRVLSTDRPDLTESPFTVDAGHWQVELDLVSASRSEAAGVRREGLAVAVANVKLGIHDRADLQVVLQPFVRARETVTRGGPAGGGFGERSGFGDLTTRLKINLWGNDGGSTALALLPFASFPSAREGLGAGEAVAGLALPVALALPREVGAGLMALASRSGSATSLLFTATAGRAIAGALAGFVEGTACREERGDGAAWSHSFDTGLTLGLAPDVQLDGGVVLGLGRALGDWTAFLGLAVRK